MVEIGPDEINPARAAALIRVGGVLAFPTETTWGLAADPANSEALAVLFALKRRPVSKPVPCIIGDMGQLGGLAAAIPDLFVPLMRRFWTGPLTLLFPVREGLPPGLSDDRGLVGIRLSSHPLARSLARQFGGAVTATSANPAGDPPALTPAGVRAAFGSDLVLLSDDICPGGCSTIVGVDHGRLVVVRPGMIPVDALSFQVKKI